MGCFSSKPSIPINPDTVDLSHFNILRVLGRGGFGKVNAVQRRSDNQYFAMKTINKWKRLRNSSNAIAMTWFERRLMTTFQSEFLVRCFHAFQDEGNLYMIMPIMLGGDLRYHLKNRGGCTEDEARFFMTEILLALEHMHSLSVVYRDLKPDNILLDADGHIRLSDFGLCGRIHSPDGKTSGRCGTNGYIAPEVAMNYRYDTSPDFYAFGVVLYELLHRQLPFPISSNQINIQILDPIDSLGEHESSSSNGISMSHHLILGERISKKLSPECRDILHSLLREDPRRRLGSGSELKWQQVKQHPWFAEIDWMLAERRGLTPSFRPNPDIANFDPSFELEEQIMSTKAKYSPLTEEEQLQFKGWEWRVHLHATEAELQLEEEENLRLLNLVPPIATSSPVSPLSNIATRRASNPNVSGIDDCPESPDRSDSTIYL